MVNMHQHRAIFQSVLVIVLQFVIMCLKSDNDYQLNFNKNMYIFFSFPNKYLFKSSHFCECILYYPFL